MNKFSIPKITLYHLINELISTDKKRTIFEIENKKITREKLYQDILNTQNYFIELKLNQKDTIVSTLENSYEQIIFFLATLSLGITWVPLGKDRKGVGLKYVLSITKPTVIFARKEKLIEIPKEYRKQVLIIKKEVEVQDGKKFARVTPSLKPSYSFMIEFNHPSIGRQEYSFEFSKKNFIEEISRARTFGFLKDVQMLRSRGLALGGSLDNAVVMDDTKILNPEGLRFSNEFVRHKILDAIGDLSLLGAPFVGDYISFAGSHNLNHELTKAILRDPSNYEIRTLSVEKAEEFEKVYA